MKKTRTSARAQDMGLFVMGKPLISFFSSKNTCYRSRFIKLFVLGLMFTSFYSCHQRDESWSQWRGPNRDGLCLETGLLKAWPEEGPELAWAAEGLGDGFSGAVIRDQVVYTTGKIDSLEYITAMDLDGNILWQEAFGRAMPSGEWQQSRSTPTVYKDEVYAISVYGDVACLDRETGALVWKVPASEKFRGCGADWYTESPLVFGNRLIFTPGGSETSLVALNRLTGETIWQSESIRDTAYFTSPILFKEKGRDVIFTSLLRHDLFVDGKTGEIIREFDHISGMVPEVIGDRIYFTGHYQKTGSLCSFSDDLAERTVVWTDTALGHVLGGAVYLDGKILTPGYNKGLFCIDMESGEVLSYMDQMLPCNMIVADSMIYSYEDSRGRVSLLALNGDKVERVSSFRVRMGKGAQIAHLALSDGLLFVRRGEVLMAYDVRGTRSI